MFIKILSYVEKNTFKNMQIQKILKNLFSFKYEI